MQVEQVEDPRWREAQSLFRGKSGISMKKQSIEARRDVRLQPYRKLRDLCEAS